MGSDVRDRITEAVELLGAARARALAATQTDPSSTWIDAFCAIDQCLTQLSWAARDTAVDGPPSVTVTIAASCEQLLQQAERALGMVAAGEGPVSLVLVRAYLTEAINEVAGREP